jgi:hypothetical protein
MRDGDLLQNGVEGLSESEVAHLTAALDDEYQSRATYAQVIADFGDVRPFSNIVDAEDRHARALIGIFERYGIPVPPDTWPGRAPRYASLHAACEAGVEGEIANAALYDEVLAGTDRADIIEVYRNLREASQERHLPAFRRCAERGGDAPGRHDDGPGAPGGGGQRRRRRRGSD